MRKGKKLFALVVVFAMLLGMMPASAWYDDEMSGKWGPDITWQITKDKELIVTGTGDIPDCENMIFDWQDYRDMIVRITVGEGIIANY